MYAPRSKTESVAKPESPGAERSAELSVSMEGGLL